MKRKAGTDSLPLSSALSWDASTPGKKEKEKKKFHVDSNDFGFVWAGVTTWLHKMNKRLIYWIWVVCNKLLLLFAVSFTSPWRFELEFFPSGLPCEQLYKFRFEANPIWYSAIKFTKSPLSEVLATHMGVTVVQHQSQLSHFNCTNLTHFRLTSRFRGNSRIVMLWVACELLQFAAIQQAGMVRAFCRSHAYTFNEQYKMATALTP